MFQVEHLMHSPPERNSLNSSGLELSKRLVSERLKLLAPTIMAPIC
jgi:hypothetical protein